MHLLNRASSNSLDKSDRRKSLRDSVWHSSVLCSYLLVYVIQTIRFYPDTLYVNSALMIWEQLIGCISEVEQIMVKVEELKRHWLLISGHKMRLNQPVSHPFVYHHGRYWKLDNWGCFCIESFIDWVHCVYHQTSNYESKATVTSKSCVEQDPIKMC